MDFRGAIGIMARTDNGCVNNAGTSRGCVSRVSLLPIKNPNKCPCVDRNFLSE